MSIRERDITEYRGVVAIDRKDIIAVEEPLQIFIRTPGGDLTKKGTPFSITMRTPGNDEYLAVGLLYSEGLLDRKEEVLGFRTLRPLPMTVEVTLSKQIDLAAIAEDRSLIQHGGCGVCGKVHLDFIERTPVYVHRPGRPMIKTTLLPSFLEALRGVQSTFGQTGGVHAACLFSPTGELIQIFEDIGRHNAMDKLIGWALINDRLPLKNEIVLLSGRASFELIQKANDAGISVVVSIGAPSSMAIEMAEENGMTLIGFLKEHSFNVYNDDGRIVTDD